MAALLLKASVASYQKGEGNIVDMDDDGLIDEESDTGFNWFERHENWESTSFETTPLSVKERVNVFLQGLGCYTFLAFVIPLLLVGFINVMNWIF